MPDYYAGFRAAEAAARAEQQAEAARLAAAEAAAEQHFQQHGAPALRAEVSGEIRRRLLLAGLPADKAQAAIASVADRITIVRRVGGPELTIDGTPAAHGVETLAAELLKRERELEAYGTDPRDELASRLNAAGVPSGDARHLARHAVSRDHRGRVVYTRADGSEVVGTTPDDAHPLDLAAAELYRQHELREAAPPAAATSRPAVDYSVL